jgi:hypothetical protein
MPCDHESDARLAQRLQQIEVLLARDAEDILHLFGFQGADKEIAGLHGDSR